MARKLFVLAALAAMMLTLASPVAFANGGQEGVAGPQPVEWTDDEATVAGLLEPDGEKLDGTLVWRMEDEASGTPYHVEQGESVDLTAFEGQRVSMHGKLGYLEGAVILVDSVERFEDATAVETQYEPGETTGEEFSGTGTVEYLDDKADDTPVYGLSTSPEEGHYMEGDFDFTALEGKRVRVTGRIVYDAGGDYLRVESIEPVSDAGGEDLLAVEENVPAVSPGLSEVEVGEVEENAAPVVSSATAEVGSGTEETVAVELASEETPLGSGSSATADEPGILSVATKALPATGGMALLLPLTGLVLTSAGLVAFRMTR